MDVVADSAADSRITGALKAWYLIEMISPKRIPMNPRFASKTCKMKHDATTPFPEMAWQLAQPELSVGVEDEDSESDPDATEDAESENLEDGYLLYLGAVRSNDIHSSLRGVLGIEATFEDDQRPARDYCALASVRLTLEGVIVPKSFVVASFSWYLGLLKRSGFENAVGLPVSQAFESFLVAAQNEMLPAGPVTAESLKELVEKIVGACGIADLPIEYSFFGKRVQYDPDEPGDLLNSFYHQDLADALAMAESGRTPPLLRALFDRSEHEEVFKPVEVSEALVEGRSLPKSAWPKERSKPALMQQVALVLGQRANEDNPIVAINGPPGTGKTTFLRSFVAETTVSRATMLAKYGDPHAGWNLLRHASETEPALYKPSEELCGFEMIVASSNNGAIENITLDLPLLESVSGYERLAEEIDHFRAVSDNVAGYGNDGRVVKTWGLVAASLGRKKKRLDFVNPLLKQGAEDDDDSRLTLPEFMSTAPVKPWEQARSAFLKAHDAVVAAQNHLPATDPTRSKMTAKDRQEHAPHVDDEVYALHTDLFAKALCLHRSFLQETWREVGSNFIAWGKLAERPHTDDFTPAEKLALWQSLFLLVPVVSTTFASARRMLSGVGLGGLQWALIDEAGQAVPQAAIGILMRCRRALVVGDPLQLEPIVNLSAGLVSKIVETCAAEPADVSSSANGASLQTMADSAGSHGTLRGEGEDAKWVGIPLVVHRRCCEPMFSMSNEVYHGDMISAVREPHEDVLAERIPFGSSAWIDLRGGTTMHAVDCQIDLARDVTVALFEHYARRSEDFFQKNHGTMPADVLEKELARWSEPSLHVITPYREIEERLAAELRRYDGIGWRWIEQHVGTIHKFQGKEAESVMLVLGLDRSHSGSAQFATERPNLMNVAVTRAKHRLYVIGDADLWGSMPWFEIVKKHLKDVVISREQFKERSAGAFDVPRFILLKQPRKRKAKAAAAPT